MPDLTLDEQVMVYVIHGYVKRTDAINVVTNLALGAPPYTSDAKFDQESLAMVQIWPDVERHKFRLALVDLWRKRAPSCRSVFEMIDSYLPGDYSLAALAVKLSNDVTDN